MWFSITSISAPKKKWLDMEIQAAEFQFTLSEQGEVGKNFLRQEIKLKVDSLFFREVLLPVLYRNENYWEPHCQIADFLF